MAGGQPGQHSRATPSFERRKKEREGGRERGKEDERGGGKENGEEEAKEEGKKVPFLPHSYGHPAWNCVLREVSTTRGSLGGQHLG